MNKKRALYVIGVVLLAVSALLIYKALADDPSDSAYRVDKFPDGSYIVYWKETPICGYDATLGLYWDNFPIPPSTSVGPAVLGYMGGIFSSAGVGCVIIARKKAKET